MNHKRIVSIGLALLFANAAPADVRLPKMFSDHMVLQREIPAAVWGWAEPGEAVTVSIAGQTAKATTDKDGKWQVRLTPIKAGGPHNLVVAGKNTITLTDVLAGDVWICAGQSNMEMGIAGVDNAATVMPAATNNLIRFLNLKSDKSATPTNDVPNGWTKCSPQTVGGLSAVGYFFAQRILAETGVPIGLVNNAWGGTPIEFWLNTAELRNGPDLTAYYQPNSPLGGIYNGRVAPLTPFAIKGVLWYQGENNGSEGEGYYQKKRALIGGWRAAWKQPPAPGSGASGGGFPFYFVQLANHLQPPTSAAGDKNWPNVREAQRKSLQIPHTGMAVAIDVGDAADIHPRNKADVGTRLALWALKNDYGQKDLVCSGPLYKSITIVGNTVRLTFDSVGRGLMVGKKAGHGPAQEDLAGKLQRFAIAGEDKNWVWADAVIESDTVIVSSPAVPKPVAVRYAFAMNPTGCNLYNRDGLPASPFRTDAW